jgi:type II secretory pathway pseudopilin PulG
MGIRTVSRIAQRRAGFTLVELLLVTVLLLMMAGAVIFSFSTLQKNATLDEGASQIEALFRYARAQAASSGRLVRIAFEEDVGDGLEVPLGNLRVEWEADPLNAPGIFSELTDAAGLIRSITELVRVEFVRAVEPDLEMAVTTTEAGATAESGGETNESVWITFPPIAFFPDGSSDSSELTVASRDEEDGRRVILKLAGLTGIVRRTMRAAEETFTDATEPAAEKPDAAMAEPGSAEKVSESPLPKLDDEKTK